MSRQIIEYGYKSEDDVRQRIDADDRLNYLPVDVRNTLAQIINVGSAQTNIAANMLLVMTYYPSSDRLYARDAAQAALALIDYDLGWKTPASAEFEFTVNASATIGGNYTIAAADALARTRPGAGEAPVQFEAREDIVVLQGQTTATGTLYAQTTRVSQIIGQTDGTDFQHVDLPDLDVVRETLQVTISATSYQRVFTFADSRSVDPHYRLFYRSDGTAYMKLPGVAEDGSAFGLRPAPGQDITAAYAVGGGLDGNGFAVDTITEYVGSDSEVTAVRNTVITGNGRIEESLENARNIAPITVRQAGGWTDDSSGLAILKQAFGEVLTAQFVRDAVEKFVVDVYILEADGSGPGPTLAAAAEILLIKQSDLQQAEVTARDPVFVDQAFSGRVAVYPGVNWANIVKYIELAIALRTSQISQAFHDTYADTGIADTIDQINSDFAGLIPYLIGGGSYSLTADQVQIEKFFQSRGDVPNIPYQRFGEQLSPQDVESVVQAFVKGVDRFVLDNPSGAIQPASGGIVRPISISVIQDQGIVEP